MSVAYIKDEPNPQPSDEFDDSAKGINDALAAGYRHLIFVDHPMGIDTTINLDSYGTGQTLIMEGAGPHIGHLNRTGHGFPLFQGGAGWTLIFRNIHFFGSGKDKNPDGSWRFTAADDLCRFTDFAAVEFTNCSFYDSIGSGLVLESTSTGVAGTVKLLNCNFANNVLTTPSALMGGLVLKDVGQVTIEDGIVERNSQDRDNNFAGMDGPGILVVSTGVRQPYGTIRGTHHELAGANGRWGIKVDGAANLQVLDTFLNYALVWLTANTSNCLVENSVVWHSCYTGAGAVNCVRDEGSGNTILYSRDITAA